MTTGRRIGDHGLHRCRQAVAGKIKLEGRPDVKTPVRRFAVLIALAALAACGGGSSSPDEPAHTQAATPGTRSAAKPKPDRPRLDARLVTASGPQRVWVTLSEPSLAAHEISRLRASGREMQVRRAARTESRADSNRKSAAAEQLTKVLARQDDAMSQLRGIGAVELGRVHVAHNAVAVRVDAGMLQTIAALDGVVAVRPVIDYETALSQTVPYVGGAAAHLAGHTGKGVRIAVIDTGIDYTHKNLGGPGTREAYVAAAGNGRRDPKGATRDGLFPTAKVVDGRDFIGDAWPEGPEAPDDDPIDIAFHGTHVADIAAGQSADGKHVGMAPDASLIALRVCSVSGRCSGLGLLQAVDWALDPNGDGDTDDAVDVINMSIATTRGQIEDDLSAASETAVSLGVVVVASAGNYSNLPYTVGSPSTADGVISVAQTRMPSTSAVALTVNTPSSIAGSYRNTLTYLELPVTATVSGEVAYSGRGCPAGTVLFPPNPKADPVLADVAGKIALIEDSSCFAAAKIDAAVKAGARGVLIAMTAPGDPVLFAFGTAGQVAPTLVIQQSLATAFKERIAAGERVSVTIAGESALSLAGSMASSSARGPSSSGSRIKPEIGAPGASVSADSGSGSAESPFGGTSGAAPMVAGAAALLIELFPDHSPERIKAMLMNSAAPAYTNRGLSDDRAPVSRVGAGELRVDRALRLTSLATHLAQKSAALSFGALEVDRKFMTAPLILRVENLVDAAKRFDVAATFRDAADRDSGAVKVIVRPQLSVAGRDAAQLEVSLLIDPAKLPAWPLDGGYNGGNGSALDLAEYDGNITLTAGDDKLTVPWHVLPRRAASTQARWLAHKPQGDLSMLLINRGSGVGAYDLFSLLGTSAELPRSTLPKPGDEFAIVDLRAVGARLVPEDYCGDVGGCVEFAISTYGRRAHPLAPAAFTIEVDSNGDGQPDHVIFNTPDTDPQGYGRTLVYTAEIATGEITSYFYADVDLNSGNMILTASMAGLGIVEGRTIDVTVTARDGYYTGRTTDSLSGLRFTPGVSRFKATETPYGEVPSTGSAKTTVSRAEVAAATSSEQGMLVMYRRNAGQEADVLRAD
jgi:minor extracellular serine protease Vpr